VIFAASHAAANPQVWKRSWPQTDFTMASIEFGEIISGGPLKDEIPPIGNPQFIAVAEETELAETEPLVSVSINGVARGYPLHILMWDEIVNDEVGGVPVTVTFCPLCNSALGDGVIAEGKDIGNVVVQRTTDEGLRDVPYSVDFAFAFHAFYPDLPIHIE